MSNFKSIIMKTTQQTQITVSNNWFNRIRTYFRPFLVTAFLFAGITECNAQIGVIVLNEGEPIPTFQWYMVKDDLVPNTSYLYDTDERIRVVLERMLKPFEMTIADAYTDQEGDRFYYLDMANGYLITVWYLPQVDGNSYLQVQAKLKSDKKEE